MDEIGTKIFALAAGKDGGILLSQFQDDYEELHHEKLDLNGYLSVELLLTQQYASQVEIVERLGQQFVVACSNSSISYLMPETNRPATGASEADSASGDWSATGPPWTILIKTLGERVMEREMERKMMQYKSFAGIHQPKNERQADFIRPYSTFFVRFDAEEDARAAKSDFHRVKREFCHQGQKFITETKTSYAFPNAKELEIRKKIEAGEIDKEAYYRDQVRERETYLAKGIVPPSMRNTEFRPTLNHNAPTFQPRNYQPRHPTYRPRQHFVHQHNIGNQHPTMQQILSSSQSSQMQVRAPAPSSFIRVELAVGNVDDEVEINEETSSLASSRVSSTDDEVGSMLFEYETDLTVFLDGLPEMAQPLPITDCPFLLKPETTPDEAVEVMVTSVELSKSEDHLQANNVLFDIIYRPVDGETKQTKDLELLEVDIDGVPCPVWPRAYQTLSNGADGFLLCFDPKQGKTILTRITKDTCRLVVDAQTVPVNYTGQVALDKTNGPRHVPLVEPLRLIDYGQSMRIVA